MLALALSACGGGGGGGGGGAPAPTNFNTAEFQANFGLGNINVLSTYDGGFTGTGQTIAVIDTGIDVDHPDLDANIAAASTDIVTGNAAFLNDIAGHGTAVAGVAAAERNASGMHGVAFDAQILAIRTDTIGSCFTACTFTDNNVAAAVDFAVANGANVINISLGGAAPSNATLQTALQNAVGAGLVIVVAAGNTGAADPLDPAVLAANATFNGQIIPVGSVDSTNAIAASSNRAGATQNFYLVAPGVNIVTTDIGGGLQTASGTSFAAPHVAGAVALTRQRFPALSATQVVNALLAAATDLGAAGTDAIFGRGLLNVSAALAPLGATSLPAGASEAEEARAMAALGASDMKLGAAFGDSIARALAATPAIIVDSYYRAFTADLSGYVHPANASPDLEALLDTGAGPRAFSANIAARSTLSLTFSDVPEETSELASRFAETPGDGTDLDTPAVTFAVGLGRRTNLALGFATALARDSELVRRAGVSFVSADLLAPPTSGMAGTGNTLVLRHELGRRTRVRFAGAVGARTFEGGYGTHSRNAAALDLERRFDGGATLGAHGGVLHEEGSFLDTVSSGAFEAAASARTGFFGVSTSLPLPSGWTAIGRSVLGLTTVEEAGPGVLSDFSRIASTAYSLGLVRRGWFEQGDAVGLVVFQPLRIVDGSARLSLPVAYDYATGFADYGDTRIGLAPSGREVGFELSYTRKVLGGAALQANLLQRFEPGHVAGAEPETTALVRFRLDF